MRVDLKTKKARMIKERRKNLRRRMRTVDRIQKIKVKECEFCGRELQNKIMPVIMGEMIFNFNLGVERCICDGAISYWKEIDRKKEVKWSLEKINGKWAITYAPTSGDIICYR